VSAEAISRRRPDARTARFAAAGKRIRSLPLKNATLGA
jgi:hypothetical protein